MNKNDLQMELAAWEWILSQLTADNIDKGGHYNVSYGKHKTICWGLCAMTNRAWLWDLIPSKEIMDVMMERIEGVTPVTRNPEAVYIAPLGHAGLETRRKFCIDTIAFLKKEIESCT